MRKLFKLNSQTSVRTPPPHPISNIFNPRNGWWWWYEVDDTSSLINCSRMYDILNGFMVWSNFTGPFGDHHSLAIWLNFETSDSLIVEYSGDDCSVLYFNFNKLIKHVQII